MPEEITTDDTFLSRSQWENNLDLIKDLDETTAICYFPKIAPRILLDDSSIDPSPINSRVNSQDIEMTSKSNFIEKNPAPSVVVLTPRKKRKIGNVTNHQLEDMSMEIKDGKKNLFRKSVVGKENQGFDVAYAESEASNLTTTTVDSPAKHFEWTDDSLDLTPTDAIVNVKMNMFMKKKSSVNLQTSFNGKNDVTDDTDAEKNTICKTVSMSTTEAALKFPVDAGSTFIAENSTKDAAAEDASKNSVEPEINPAFEKDLAVDPETSFTSQSVVSSQDDSTTFNKPVRPFSRPLRKKKNDNFNVQGDDTSIFTSKGDQQGIELAQDGDSMISTQSSQEETLSQANEKRNTLFSKRSTKEANFEVDFETTGSGNNASTTTNSAKENNLTKMPGNDIEDGEELGEGESTFSVPSSQEGTLTESNEKRNTIFIKKCSKKADFDINSETTASTQSSQDETFSRANEKRSTLFSKRSTKEADFEVNFETTGSGNNASNLDSSAKRNDITKTPQSDNENSELSKESPFSVPSSQEDASPRRNVKRSTLFNKRKTRKPDFKVNFEETGSESPNLSNLENSRRENDITKNSASESALLSQKGESVNDKRKSLFVRRSERKKDKSFHVSFEQTIVDSMSNKTSNELSLNASADTQPSSKKSKQDRKTILFQKKSNIDVDPFDVSCNESNISENASKSDEKSVQESPISRASTSKIGSQRSSALSHTQDSSVSYSDRSRMSQNLTVIDKTEKSIKTMPIISDRTLNSTQSSFNDDNLNGYMSDQSENSSDEQVQTVPTAEVPSPIPVENPPPFLLNREKSAPSNNIEKVTDWELKFQEIVEKAGRGENIRKKKSFSSQPLPVEKKKIQPKHKNSENNRKPKLKKPAPYATKRLYKFLTDRLEPKYGIDATIKAEELVVEICETVKIVTRRETYQKKLINDLKVDMAKLGIIETTMDFYNFIRDFLPESFREKSIPRIQPFTCQVWPPKDVANPFDKIL